MRNIGKWSSVNKYRGALNSLHQGGHYSLLHKDGERATTTDVIAGDGIAWGILLQLVVLAVQCGPRPVSQRQPQYHTLRSQTVCIGMCTVHACALCMRMPAVVHGGDLTHSAHCRRSIAMTTASTLLSAALLPINLLLYTSLMYDAKVW